MFVHWVHVLQTGTVGIGSSSLLSSKRADDLEEPSPSLPQLRRDRMSGSGSGSGTQHNPRRMSLFTDGVPGLPLLPNPADNQVCVCVCVCVCVVCVCCVCVCVFVCVCVCVCVCVHTHLTYVHELYNTTYCTLQGGTRSSGSLHSLGPSDSTNDMEDPLAKSLPLNGGANSTKRKLKLKKLRRMSAYVEDHFESRSGRKSTASVESKVCVCSVYVYV